jgi:hypothetical protein
MKSIAKRSFKNYSKRSWNEYLTPKNWSAIKDSESLDKMVSNLKDIVRNSMNECLPVKNFKVRETHKFGTSESTKKLIKERDSARKQIKLKSPAERAVHKARCIWI